MKVIIIIIFIIIFICFLIYFLMMSRSKNKLEIINEEIKGGFQNGAFSNVELIKEKGKDVFIKRFLSPKEPKKYIEIPYKYLDHNLIIREYNEIEITKIVPDAPKIYKYSSKPYSSLTKKQKENFSDVRLYFFRDLKDSEIVFNEIQMEYIPGKTLIEYLSENNYPVEDIKAILYQYFLTIKKMVLKGFIPLDLINPANIIVQNKDGKIKIRFIDYAFWKTYHVVGKDKLTDDEKLKLISYIGKCFNYLDYYNNFQFVYYMLFNQSSLEIISILQKLEYPPDLIEDLILNATDINNYSNKQLINLLIGGIINLEEFSSMINTRNLIEFNIRELPYQITNNPNKIRLIENKYQDINLYDLQAGKFMKAIDKKPLLEKMVLMCKYYGINIWDINIYLRQYFRLNARYTDELTFIDFSNKFDKLKINEEYQFTNRFISDENLENDLKSKVPKTIIKIINPLACLINRKFENSTIKYKFEDNKYKLEEFHLYLIDNCNYRVKSIINVENSKIIEFEYVEDQ